jgi:chromosome partitioning protein
LTALDNLDAAGIGTHPSLDQVAARKEVTSLLLRLNLPLDERGRRRAANRAEWLNQADKPLEVDDIIRMPAIGLQNKSALSKEAAQ